MTIQRFGMQTAVLQAMGDHEPGELTKIPPHMLQEIPAIKVPELLNARGGYSTLLDHINHLKYLIENLAQDAISREGGEITGELTLGGGATVPASEDLIVDGNAVFNGIATFNGVAAFNSSISSVAEIDTDGQFGVSTVVANTYNYNVPVYENTIIDFTPTTNGNFLIYVYLRVQNINTDVTVKVRYNDAGGEQELVILNVENQTPGVYTLPPFYISAAAGYPIDVRAQSSNANRVFMSANIIGL